MLTKRPGAMLARLKVSAEYEMPDAVKGGLQRRNLSL